MRLALLQPLICSTRNRFFPPGSKPIRTIGIGLFCAVVCLALHLVSLKILRYFHSQNELGIILSLKIFEMAWIIMFAMLVFSCMVSAVSSIFLSMDNEILGAAPVPPTRLFFMRYVTTLVYVSWMMVLFSLPVFAAFGQVFGAGWLYWPFMGWSVVSTAMTAVGVGMLATILLVNLFPARRTKDIVLYLSLCFGIFIYSIFRLLRPEDLANPEKFADFLDYLSAISTPAGPYVPAAWAANLLSVYLLDREVDWLLLGLLLLTPGALYVLGELAMHRGFLSGYTKSQESFGGHRRFGLGRPYRPSVWRHVWAKEARTFFRDSAEWSQIFMIAALVVVYLYNFTVLPLDRTFWKEEYLANLISFLNIGLTGFVVVSLCARFVFPSIGAEGGAFFLLQSSPVPMRHLLRLKGIFYAIPFTVLALILVIVSDALLKIQGPIWWISVLATLCITWTAVAVAIGFGALFADFKAENRATALGGVGAVLFLLTSLAYIGVLLLGGAYPSYLLTRKWLKGEGLALHDLGGVVGWGLLAAAGSWLLASFFFRRGVEKVRGAEPG